jgi:hypothetical protein
MYDTDTTENGQHRVIWFAAGALAAAAALALFLFADGYFEARAGTSAQSERTIIEGK